MITETTETRTRARIDSAPAHYRSLLPGDGEPRFAWIVGRTTDTVAGILRYLPANYVLLESFIGQPFGRDALVVIIGGRDSAGWTLDGYVIPRLQSGLYGCREIGGAS